MNIHQYLFREKSAFLIKSHTGIKNYQIYTDALEVLITNTVLTIKNAKRRFRRLHRKSVNTYLTTLDMELDNAAELDQKRFWKLIRRRRCNLNRLGAGINFNGSVVRDRLQLTQEWGHYFEKLYTPINKTGFDGEWHEYVSAEVKQKFRSLHSDPNATVCPRQIRKAILEYPSGKASGPDN
ncbi:hypothetical protein MAR_010988, partial [Mya arenaria]